MLIFLTKKKEGGTDEITGIYLERGSEQGMQNT